jgi:2-oxoglutarate ferredoxin oxidoreductase subunit beta
MHWMLINMKGPDFPVALGVIRATKGTTYDNNLEEQIAHVKATSPLKTMNDLLHSGATWKVND